MSVVSVIHPWYLDVVDRFFLSGVYDWFFTPFIEFEFLGTAFLAGFFTVLTTSVVGTWVVLRGMTFLSDALSHGVLPGIALAFALGFNATLGACVAALLMIGGVDQLRKYSPLPEDTSIGLLFVGFLSVAVIIISASSGSPSVDMSRLLFGEIAAVERADLLPQGLLALVVLLVVRIFYRAFLVLTYDETQARLLGMRPGLANKILLTLIGISVVASFETVGSLLVFAFLVAPPAAASLLVQSVPKVMLVAVLLGTFSVYFGLLFSVHYGTAGGATISFVSVLFYGLSMILRIFLQRNKRLQSAVVRFDK